jgi:hypothetical protein
MLATSVSSGHLTSIVVYAIALALSFLLTITGAYTTVLSFLLWHWSRFLSKQFGFPLPFTIPTVLIAYLLSQSGIAGHSTKGVSLTPLLQLKEKSTS